MDFETASELSVRDCGPSRYSRHHSTKALMLVTIFEKKFRRWRLDLDTWEDKQGIPPFLVDLINQGCTFHAFNVAFEINIWRNIMAKKHGWPDIPNSQWFCTQAKASYNNMPKSLDKLCVRCQLPERFHKDKTGKLLIQKLSTPTKATKAILKEGKIPCFPLIGKNGKEAMYYFNVDPDLHDQFLRYCEQDVRAEIAADSKLIEIPEVEIPNFYMDMEINQRGFKVDRALCVNAAKIHKAAVEETNIYLQNLTGDPKMKVTTDDRLKKWMIDQGYTDLENEHSLWVDTTSKKKDKKTGEVTIIKGRGISLKESLVIRYLDLPEAKKFPIITEAINKRAEARSNTVTKYKTCLEYIDDDDRVRHSERYYGAATGRWTGSGFHPHNFKRLKIPSEFWFDVLKTGNIDIVNMMLPAVDGKHKFENAIDVLKSCVRGIIIAEEDHEFIISDFAGIENRVNHWFCGNHRMLDLFARKQDIYIEAVCQIWKVKHEEVAYWDADDNKWKILEEHYEKRQVGKQAELGLGYGMGAQTFQMHLHNDGIDVDPEFTQQVVSTWRGVNKVVKDTWYKLQEKCEKIVRGLGRNSYLTDHVGPCTIRGIRHKDHNNKDRKYMEIVLPSGRSLLYFQPRMRKRPKKTVKDDDREEICYRDGSKGGMFGEVGTYGAKILENIVQAISRDLLCNSMRIIEDSGRKVILHVQDESVTEASIYDEEAFSICHNAMENVPHWAEGLPLHAETHKSRRYTK